jgi:uncharacterized repeat protein (TIGR03803 family)
MWCIPTFFPRRCMFAILFFWAGSAALGFGQYKSLYDFQGGGDGWGPSAILIADKSGNLYGNTTNGGTGSTFCSFDGCGTIFELQPPAQPGGPWTKTILYNFQGIPDGYWPSAGRMVMDKSGNLYGTTQFGGSAPYGYGTVFELSPPSQPGGPWTETILYNFTGGNDGGVPANGLVADAAGNLYGTTNDGGAYGQEGSGTIFELSPPPVGGGAWAETTLYSFQQIKDGDEPNELTLDGKGNLYGTRTADNILCTPGNPKFCGSAFELQRRGTNWQMKLLHQFQGKNDGSSPWSGMIFDALGNLYGTTIGFGGNISTAGGIVYELSPPAGSTGPWNETILYTFSGGADGGQPLDFLIFDPQGNLYDTTFYGGNTSCNLGLGCGVVFKLAPPSQQGEPWTETVLHTFLGGTDGQDPSAALTWGKNGALYGTATGGGGSESCNGGCGTVFDVRR